MIGLHWSWWLRRKKVRCMCVCMDYRRFMMLCPRSMHTGCREYYWRDAWKNQIYHYVWSIDWLLTGTIETGAQSKMAFTTPFGLYNFKWMPFGLYTRGTCHILTNDGQGLRKFRQWLSWWSCGAQLYLEGTSAFKDCISKLESADSQAQKCQLGIKQCIYRGL